MSAYAGPSSECGGILGYVFGHKFKARYSTKSTSSPPDPSVQKEVLAAVMDDMYIDTALVALSVETSRECAYMGDVCVRCGAWVRMEGRL